mgnify:FL=1
MVDAGDADDKIIAVLCNDSFWGEVTTISQLPAALIERLRHYFLTYKLVPGQPARVEIDETYDSSHAQDVVRAAIEDYSTEFGSAVPESR